MKNKKQPDKSNKLKKQIEARLKAELVKDKDCKAEKKAVDAWFKKHVIIDI